MSEMKFKRVLLKLSGEILRGQSPNSHDERVIERLAKEVKQVADLGIEILIVVGVVIFFAILPMLMKKWIG